MDQDFPVIRGLSPIHFSLPPGGHDVAGRTRRIHAHD